MTADYANDVVGFIDQMVPKNELGRPWRLAPHQREILTAAFVFQDEPREHEDGTIELIPTLPWTTFVYSAPKKSGKTTVNAAITLWWAMTQEAPNELAILANDLEQAQSRVLSTILRLIRQNPGLAKSVASTTASKIVLTNGTEIVAVASDPSSAAGPNLGFSSWDELWAYISERARRLWEELTPVSTRDNSIRFITTYAGWENESSLLWEAYLRGVGLEEHPEGQGERIHPDLPLYLNRAARQVTYWDHARRMPWQQRRDAYDQEQRQSMRAGTYLRLHENRWATSETRFITPEIFDQNVDPSHRPLLTGWDHRLFIGLDAAPKHDTSAAVAVCWQGDRLTLACHRIWRPTVAEPLDFAATLEAWIAELMTRMPVGMILCDPYQLHSTITKFKALLIPIREYHQTAANLTVAGQTLWDVLQGKNLRLYAAPDLREQVLNAVVVETPRGFRLAKEKASRKIDAAVALSMACVAALDMKPKALNPNATPIEVGARRSSPWSMGEPLPSYRSSAGGGQYASWWRI